MLSWTLCEGGGIQSASVLQCNTFYKKYFYMLTVTDMETMKKLSETQIQQTNSAVI